MWSSRSLKIGPGVVPSLRLKRKLLCHGFQRLGHKRHTERLHRPPNPASFALSDHAPHNNESPTAVPGETKRTFFRTAPVPRFPPEACTPRPPPSSQTVLQLLLLLQPLLATFAPPPPLPRRRVLQTHGAAAAVAAAAAFAAPGPRFRGRRQSGCCGRVGRSETPPPTGRLRSPSRLARSILPVTEKKKRIIRKKKTKTRRAREAGEGAAGIGRRSASADEKVTVGRGVLRLPLKFGETRPRVPRSRRRSASAVTEREATCGVGALNTFPN